MERWFIQLPDRDLAYLPEGSKHFEDYIEAVGFAQAYAARNRQAMMTLILAALERHLPPFEVTSEGVNCHHNYVEREHHFGADVWVTRKGAIRASAAISWDHPAAWAPLHRARQGRRAHSSSPVPTAPAGA